MKARALSIRQPWASLCAAGLKDIENRSWPTRFRGPFLIHAAKGMTKAEWGSAVQFAIDAGISKDRLWDLCSIHTVPRGGVIGYAEITDCVDTSSSRWFMGEFGFGLANAHALPFMPLTGRLGFFEVDLPDGYLPPHLAARFAP